MAIQHNVVTTLALILLGLLTTYRTADGQVPTAVDFAACNQDALQGPKAGTASPTVGDRIRAAGARADAAAPTNSLAVRGKVSESSDPQIHGMEAEGARDASYQAAYRTCMRRKGF